MLCSETKVYAGNEHNHAAQQPQVLDINRDYRQWLKINTTALVAAKFRSSRFHQTGQR